MNARVFVVDGVRTPFLGRRPESGSFSPADLAVWAGRALLSRSPVRPERVDEMILGCMTPPLGDGHIARTVALRLGLGMDAQAFSVQRQGASGLQALSCAYDRLSAQRTHLVVAGGTDVAHIASMRRTLGLRGVARLYAAKFGPRRLAPLYDFLSSKLRSAPSPPFDVGHFVGQGIGGRGAEIIAQRFGINRLAQDRYAAQSHERAASAWKAGRFDGEVEAIYGSNGAFYVADDAVRAGVTFEQLAELPALFDPPYGTVTAGNSAVMVDGAALLLLASEAAVKRFGLTVMAEIVGYAWAGVDPARRRLGMVHAIAKLLRAHNLKLGDLAHIELNEESSAHVLACQSACAADDYAHDELHREAPLGVIDPARLNPHGGALAMGHSFGASGARLALHVARSLQEQQGALGVVALCAGGGDAGAMLIRGGFVS